VLRVCPFKVVLGLVPPDGLDELLYGDGPAHEGGPARRTVPYLNINNISLKLYQSSASKLIS